MDTDNGLSLCETKDKCRKTKGRAVAGIMELRIGGITDRAKPAHSSQPFYTFSTFCTFYTNFSPLSFVVSLRSIRGSHS